MSASSSPTRFVVLLSAILAAPLADALPNLSVSTTTVNFGSVAITQTPTIAVTITNVSGGTIGPLNGLGGAVPAPFNASQNCQGATLAAGGTCQMFFDFAPTALGPANATSNVTWNGEPFSIALSGLGISGLVVASNSVNFGSVAIGQTSTIPVTITNVTGGPIGPLNGLGGAVPAPFNASQNCQGATLAAGGTCQMFFDFAPTALGPANATSNVIWNGEPFSIALSGIGIAATCALTCPASVSAPNDPNQCGAVVNYPAPTVTGPCGTVTASPASGSFFPVGTVTVNATETGGAACSFTVTVNDTQLPTITVPANMSLTLAEGQTSAVVSYPPPNASDNCPGVTVASVPPSGSTFLVGTTTVTATATDASQNTASGTFLIALVRFVNVPTLGEYGLLLLTVLLAAAGWWHLRRRRT
jgi:hypothetical protein